MNELQLMCVNELPNIKTVMQALSDVLTSRIVFAMLDHWFNTHGGRKTSRERHREKLIAIEIEPITFRNTVGLKLNEEKTAQKSGQVDVF